MALDQDVVRLAQAIRQVESGGDYSAKGASGESGAYQFMPETWKEWSRQYLGDENAPMTKINQNKVAYLKIKDLKDQGLRANQIASIWNSGRPDYEGRVGVNKFGVNYDVPAYVSKVGRAYKELKAQQVPVAEASTEMSKVPAQDSVSSLFGNIRESTEGTREERIAQGLPVGSKAREERTGSAKPSFGGTLVRGALSPLATLAATATTGFRDKVEEGSEVTKPMRTNFFGDVNSLMSSAERGVDAGVRRVEETGKLSSALAPVLRGALNTTARGAGTGLEVGSYAIGAGPLSGLAKGGLSTITKPTLRQVAGQFAKTEAKAGAVGAFGESLERNIANEVPAGQAIERIAGDTARGGVGGAVIGPIAGVGLRTAGNITRLLTPAGRTTLSNEAVEKSVSSLKDLFSTQSGVRYVDNVSLRKGDEPFKLIVESGALKRSDIKNNKVITTKGVQILREGQEEFNKLLQESLDPAIEPRLVSIDEAVKRTIKRIDDSQYTPATKKRLKAQVAKDFDAIIEEFGTKDFNLQTINSLKQKFWREAFPEGKAVTDVDKLTRNRKYLVGQGLMKTVEDFAENPDIRELNQVIGTYAEAQKVLNNLSKQTLKKGQLGRYVLQGAGTIVGTSAGGPLGGLAGALGGDIVTNILQKLSVNSPLRSGLIKYITKYRPDLSDKLSAYLSTRASEAANAPLLPAGPIVIPQRVGESSVTAVPAGKGIPGRSPKTGRFFKTFSSTDNDITLPKGKSTEQIRNIVEIDNGTIVLDPDRYKAYYQDFEPANHPKYSKMVDESFKKHLANPNLRNFSYTAGGSGSGKSELVTRSLLGETDVIVDGTFKDYAKSVAKINEALAAGKEVGIYAVIPDYMDAWKFVQKRADETGRDVPKKIFAQSHVGVINTLTKLIKEGYNVSIKDTRGINSLQKAKQAVFMTDAEEMLSMLSELSYTVDDILDNIE